MSMSEPAKLEEKIGDVNVEVGLLGSDLEKLRHRLLARCSVNRDSKKTSKRHRNRGVRGVKASANLRQSGNEGRIEALGVIGRERPPGQRRNKEHG